MEHIKSKNIAKEYLDNMTIYSMMVNMKRAIPDVKDGLKPVQRRLLYTMCHVNHATSYNKKVKSQAITARTMELFHPHGAPYGPMKPMANDFECKAPLIQPGGSFGSIMGEPAAAPRYTEANLTEFALDAVIASLYHSKSVVDWIDNYTNTTKEPEFLPAIIPLLLINGAEGIGVGMKVDIPQHCINEVIDATLRVIDNNNTKVVLVPDHCIPCEIIDTNWKSISETGHGSYKARGFTEIRQTKQGNPQIIITSLPVYNTDIVKDQIENMVRKGSLPQVIDVNDASKEDIEIIITLKKNTESEIPFIKEMLYKYTNLEKSFPVNFEVVDKTERIRFSYKEYIQYFIDFAVDNKYRYFYSLLTDINTKMHRLEAFIKVLKSGDIEKIVHKIRNRKETEDALLIEFLIKLLDITDLQARYIIDTQLKRLSTGHLKQFEAEYAKLSADAKLFDGYIRNQEMILKCVKEDLLFIKKKYGKSRICPIIKVSNTSNIPQGEFNIVVTENNFIRKLSISDNVNTIRGDKPKYILRVDNTEHILMFDNKGKVFKIAVHKIPITNKSEPGLDIRRTISGLTADIVNVMYEPWLKKAVENKKSKLYIAMVTKGNVCKKLDIGDFINVPQSGIIYSKLNDGDEIIDVQFISDHLDAIIYSDHKAIRISSKDIPCYKRNTIGVSAMNTKTPLEGLSIIYPEATSIIVVTKSGKVNKFNVNGLSRSTRNKAGTSVIKLGKGDSIHSILGLTEANIINITTTAGIITVAVKDIPSGTSVSTGTKLISTKSDTILKVEMIK